MTCIPITAKLLDMAVIIRVNQTIMHLFNMTVKTIVMIVQFGQRSNMYVALKHF